jgi:hypothetical protein
MKKFILWDKRDNYRPRQDDDGNITSDGVIGRVDIDNVYIRVYAEYPGAMQPKNLEVGQCISNVVFRLSGERGIYDVYRVQ